MKTLRLTRWALGLIAMLMVSMIPGSVLAEDQAIHMQDYEKLAKEAYANADGTKKICEGVVQKLKAQMAEVEPSELLKHEVEDALFWFKKADELLTSCKKQMDEKKFTKDLVIQLNQSWQWFIKAGSAGVRATMMD